MKRVCLLIALIFMVAIVKAQNGTKYFSLRGGWIAESAYIGTLSYDFNTIYFNQNEVFAEYYQDYKTPSIKTFMGGFAVKPVLFRSKNTAIRYRFGASMGTTVSSFVAAPQVGFEFSQSLGSGFDFLIMNRNQYVLFGDTPERWRVGVEVGIRIPIN